MEFADIVRGAWDFDGINAAYQAYAEVLAVRPKQSLTQEPAAKSFYDWLREERLAWKQAMAMDPLLPKCLHPPGYRGVKVWKRRLDTFAEAGQQIRSFRPQ